MQRARATDAKSNECRSSCRVPTQVGGRHGSPHDDTGFSLIEMVIAFALLALVVLALSGTLAVGLNLVQKSKVNQITATLANAEIERIRALRDRSSEAGESLVNEGGYDAIGVKDGNPPGDIEPTRTETVRGIDYEIAVDVSFIQDQIPGEPTNFSASKLVVVTVSPMDEGIGKPVTSKTIIAPETSANPATVFFNVFDASTGGTTPVAGVGVRLSEGGFNISQDFTDADGKAIFAGLEPGVTYDVEVSDLNWPSGLATCDSTTVTPNALDSVTVNCFVAKPLTLNVDVTDAGGVDPPAGDYAVAIWMEGNGFVPTEGEVHFSGSSAFAPAPPETTWTLTHVGGEEMRQNMTYYVAVWGAGMLPVWQEVTPGYPLSGEYDVDMSPADSAVGSGEASLTVEQSGAPVPNARVLVVDAGTGDEVLKYAVTSTAGQVGVHLPPGTYDLTAEKDGAQAPVTQITVVDGGSDTYTLVLP